MIHLTNVCKTYRAAAKAVQALRDVTLEIRRGECVSLVGKSGSGKSTLLNLIAGMDRPTRGRIVIEDADLAQWNSSQMADYRRQSVGMVFQSYNLVASWTALQNIQLPMIFAGRPPAQRRQSARQALADVGLEHRADHRPSELSGGEQQRVAIARALINRPRILLADEPTGNLDAETSSHIMTLLCECIHQNQMTAVLVTHDRGLAGRFGHRVLYLNDGRLSSRSPTEQQQSAT